MVRPALVLMAPEVSFGGFHWPGRQWQPQIQLARVESDHITSALGRHEWVQEFQPAGAAFVGRAMGAPRGSSSAPTNWRQCERIIKLDQFAPCKESGRFFAAAARPCGRHRFASPLAVV